MGDFSANPNPAPEQKLEKKAFVPENSQKPVDDIAKVDESVPSTYKDFSENLTEEFGKKYKSFSLNEKKLLYELLEKEEKFSERYNALTKILFSHAPPSPTQFLDYRNGFISYHTYEGLYPHVKRDFLAAMDPTKNYPFITMYGSTRSGKSVLARLFVLYTAVYVNYLRDPHLYFKINKMSKISLWLLSFKDEKTKELLLDPLLNLLDGAPKFQRQHFERTVYTQGVTKEGVINFSEAGKFGAITFPKLKIATGRDPSSLVGSDCIAGVISELNFFKDYVPGLTDEDVMDVYTKLTSRIMNTIGHSSFPCWTYLDSSANNADSPLEMHIMGKLSKQENCYFQHYCLWELRPYLYPIWNEDRTKTFKVIIGDGSYQAKIVRSSADLEGVPQNLVIDVPIDLHDEFEKNLVNAIRDIAGRATTSTSKFLQSTKLIEKIWDQYLPNIEGIITADSGATPQRLIWDRVQNLFFAKYDGTHYKLKRASKEPRWLHIDTAYSVKGDVIGITMIHKEFCQQTKDVIYVCDFSFTIGPGENGINLEALGWFIKDMVSIGQVTLNLITVDTFQSETTVQFLRREGINAEKLSVDTSLEPYMFLYSCLLQENLRVGKNIFLKNNLNSLYRKRGKSGKEKIDHTLGTTTNTYNGDFERSVSGSNAKDCSDSLAGALFNAQKSNHYPVSIYEKENERLYGAGGTVVNAKTPVFSPVIKEIYNSIHKNY